MLLNPGTRSTIGGHHQRAGWFTARPDGKPRWIGSREATNLQITLDPIQTNPQTITTARDYLYLTGLLPHYDVSQTDCKPPPSGTISCGPLTKGIYDDTFYDWNGTPPSINSGGNGNRIALIVGNMIRDFFLQTAGTAQNNRITALGWATYPGVTIDVNGRIPNILDHDLPGLVPHNPTKDIYSLPVSTDEPNGIGSATVPGSGGWGSYGVAYDTTHYPNNTFYPYLIEGGAHLRDAVIFGSNNTVMWYPAARGGQYINRGPTLDGITYDGNRCCSASGEREEAWALREVVLPAAVLPDVLADGTPFGETRHFKAAWRHHAPMRWP
jgi:hypothetical protein